MQLPSGKLTGSLDLNSFHNLDERDLKVIAKQGNFRRFVFGGRAKTGGLGEGKATYLAREILLKKLESS